MEELQTGHLCYEPVRLGELSLHMVSSCLHSVKINPTMLLVWIFCGQFTVPSLSSSLLFCCKYFGCAYNSLLSMPSLQSWKIGTLSFFSSFTGLLVLQGL